MVLKPGCCVEEAEISKRRFERFAPFSWPALGLPFLLFAFLVVHDFSFQPGFVPSLGLGLRVPGWVAFGWVSNGLRAGVTITWFEVVRGRASGGCRAGFEFYLGVGWVQGWEQV